MKNNMPNPCESIASDMIDIPGGTFHMGLNMEEYILMMAEIKKNNYYDDFCLDNGHCHQELVPEVPLHPVTLSPFRMGRYPVTQYQWQSIMGNNPSQFQLGKDYPVEKVSWDDCQEFILRLNQMSGSVYRLPTEAEWEYTCRAGSHTTFSYGDTFTVQQANFDGSRPFGKMKPQGYLRTTTPVGAYPPNQWGLFGMHGNVNEWCQDWYDDDYYKKSSDVNPQGPPSSPHLGRVYRGGCYFSWGIHCRCAKRDYQKAHRANTCVGLRLVNEISI